MPGSARLVEQGLAGLPAASLTDAYLLRNRLPVAEILGPSSLAYLDPAEFPPQPGSATITPLDLDDPVFRQFVLAADPGEVEESGIREITTPAFAVREHGGRRPRDRRRQAPAMARAPHGLTARRPRPRIP